MIGCVFYSVSSSFGAGWVVSKQLAKKSISYPVVNELEYGIGEDGTLEVVK